jgi:hypothetical protein
MSDQPPLITPAASAPPPVMHEPMVAVGEPAVHLTVAQYEAISRANHLYKPIRRAMGIASFNAYGAAFMAILAIPFAPFSITAAIAMFVLAAVACIETRGRLLLQRLNPAATKWLGWNQAFFLAMIALYCAFAIVQAMLNPVDLTQTQGFNQLPQNVQDMITEFNDLYAVLVFAIYGVIAGLSALYLGLICLYYFTRRKHILRFIEESPAWVVALYRMDAGVKARPIRAG